MQETNNNNSQMKKSFSRQSSAEEQKASMIHSETQSSLSSASSCSDDMRLLNSNSDYDHIRNTTLMFFLDRLYIASKDGQEARTLHDLSCLFGTKDFTKEMRSIVGASRNGLKKFLQSYPSLFTIEGDKVYLSQLKQDPTNPAVRDYNKEAVEYFKEKLLQFGSSLVPIKNLFGYRSQASQEVRHVTGRNAKEFRFFLSQHEDVFEILVDDHVVLKSTLNELQTSGKLLQPAVENDASFIDPYLNKQFAHLIETFMRTMSEKESASERISIEELHEKIMKDCENKLFLNMVKTVEDLRVFLRMHPKIFKRINVDEDCELVCLLTEEERRELEALTYPSTLNRQHSTLKRCDTNESNLSSSASFQQPVSLPNFSNNNHNHKQQSTKTFNTNQQASTTINQPQANKSLNAATKRTVSSELTDADLKSIESNSSNHNSLNGGNSSLRATAPPFVPITNTNQQVSQNNKQRISLQRSFSNQHSTRSNQIAKVNSTTRQPLASVGGHFNQIVSRQNSSFGDDLRARTVNIVREASNIISRIMSCTDAVAFDCKGYNLGSNGQITLIQFGFLANLQTNTSHHPLLDNNNSTTTTTTNRLKEKQKPEVCVFDLITNPELAYCLKPLLESDKIVKIVHDVRNKSNALYNQFEIMLNHVFDTQVANLVIQQQETGKPAYKSRYISMSKLCEIYGDEALAKYRNVIQSKTRHSGSSSSSRSKDVNYWRARPLTDAMVYESTLDVYSLVGGVYQNLKSRIKPEYEPLFEQLNLEGVLARIKPDEIRSVKKERKIDLEVIDLKRKLYRDSTGSIVLSNREIRLLRHIDLTEEVRQKIQQCNKVARKLERLDNKAAQLLQSLNSQESNNDESLDPDNSVNKIGSSSSSNSNYLTINNNEMDTNHHEESSGDIKETCDGAELGEMGMSNLMESSMFDELKDKMIESSSLLESLEDDDEDDTELIGSSSYIKSGNTAKHKAHLEHSGSHDSDCHCNCHRGSIDYQAKVNSSKSTNSPTARRQSDPNTDVKDGSSLESKAVDMAVQCDLLA